jgi:hypothetical protein
MLSHMAEEYVATLMAHIAAAFFKEERSVIQRTWAMKRNSMASCSLKNFA